MLHVHMHDWVEHEKQIEEKFKLNQTGKTKLVNHLSSTGRNFLIRDRNSAFYLPLESLQNSLGFWYSRFFQISFGIGLKVQIDPDSSICPELTPPPNFSDHSSWAVGRSVRNWHLPQNLYHFCIVRFSWFYTSLSQRSFARLSLLKQNLS
jgi:hypothetical protein